MAKLIVFEGPDSVGKGTQSKLLVETLQSRGLKVTRVEPTKESHPQGRRLIYSMLESGSAKRYPNAFQFVQFLNRLYFQWAKLPKLLSTNDVVVMDRWALSGYVYGAATGINPTLNDWMYARAKKPDAYVVLLGKSYKRAQADDSYERDTALQQQVKRLYAMSRPRCISVDNSTPVEDVNKRIVNDLELWRVL